MNFITWLCKLCLAPPMAPDNISVYTLDAWSVRVGWIYNPKFDDLKGVLRWYRIYYQALDNPRDTTIKNTTVSSNIYSVILNDLLPDTEYRAYVAGVTIYEGVKSLPSSNTTLEFSKCLFFLCFVFFLFNRNVSETLLNYRSCEPSSMLVAQVMQNGLGKSACSSIRFATLEATAHSRRYAPKRL